MPLNKPCRFFFKNVWIGVHAHLKQIRKNAAKPETAASEKQATEQQTSGHVSAFAAACGVRLGNQFTERLVHQRKIPTGFALPWVRYGIESGKQEVFPLVCMCACVLKLFFAGNITAHFDFDGFWLRSHDPSSSATVQWSLTRRAGWYIQSTHASTFQVDNNVFDVGIIPCFCRMS